jgi:prepilin-type processing-associated H-X9-DG protein
MSLVLGTGLMNANKGLTRIDAIITVACVALVLAQAAVLNAGGRERSKLELCLANLRSLVNAWQSYSGNNSGKIPVGDIGYSWTFPTSASIGVSPTPPGPQRAWCEYPHNLHPAVPTPNAATNWGNNVLSYSATFAAADAIWQHAISEGTLWKYVGDYNIYRCPDGDKGARITFYMSMSLATYPNAGGTTMAIAPQIININQVIRPAERFVFLDVGSIKSGAFFVPYSSNTAGLLWNDLPPVRHGLGTNFVFADGHVEYRKWTDPHTIEATKHDWGGQGWSNAVDNSDCDLRWIGHATWGKVYFANPSPSKHCEY